MFLFTVVQGGLTIRPVNTVVALGETVQLPCKTDLPDAVEWHHQPVQATRWRSVFSVVGEIGHEYQPRFNVTPTDQGHMDLTIRDVTFEDAGSYQCIDEGGLGLENGQFGEAVLVVFGNDCV